MAMAEKHKARLAAFVILERDGKILLARRANTGYADGMYQMPSGHVEAGELPHEAAIREAKEEVGVDIDPRNLSFAHACYRINLVDDVGDYVDFFFRTSVWSGEPENREPEKCDELLWVSADALPEATVAPVKAVLAHIREGRQFSEVRQSTL